MQRLGGTIRRDPKTDLLTVNDEFTVSLVIARCLTTPAGHSRWTIRLDTGLYPDLTVAVRMAEGTLLRAEQLDTLPKFLAEQVRQRGGG